MKLICFLNYFKTNPHPITSKQQQKSFHIFGRLQFENTFDVGPGYFPVIASENFVWETFNTFIYRVFKKLKFQFS